MANQWFRVYAEFATDPKVQMLSEVDQRRLVMLFCFRCNDHVTLHDEEVTFMLRISNEEWQVTKALFVDKGFIDNDCNVLNWDKRQFISDSSAERVARHRAKNKKPCNVTVTPPDTEQTQNRTDTEHKKQTPLAMLMAMGVSKQLAGDWLKVRKAKNAAPTQTAFDTIKNHAEKNGYTFAAAVRIATSENWAGFKIDWVNKPSASKGFSNAREDGRQVAAKSIFKPSNTQHLTKEIEVYDEQQKLTA